jgi:superfamily II DNA/RNA helicase
MVSPLATQTSYRKQFYQKIFCINNSSFTMSKRPNETEEERKLRKKAKKAKKKAKHDSKPERKTKKASKKQVETLIEEQKTNVKPVEVEEFQSFSDAPFVQPIQDALKDAGFTTPSPIQARAWPAVLQGKDLIAVAKTGSGKTLGFLLPVFHLINLDKASSSTMRKPDIPSPLCLVLAPTRELAIQINRECVKFGNLKGVGILSECVYGGASAKDQIELLRKNNPQVVIATPGRLCDLLERKSLNLSSCTFCVLDEADRMLDMGFEPQLKQIMAALPDKAQRQTLFFTATWPKAVRRVAATFLREDQTREVFIGEGGDADGTGELQANKAVTQSFIQAQDDEKDKKLYEILCALDEKASIVIFANTKRRVDFLAKVFWDEGFTTCAVHGDKPQHERDASLQKFVNKQCAIMVATDVAARGLDIKGVTHVINFDMARDVESYVHRIGRTGRAGELGESITFWNPDYDKVCSPALVKMARDAGQKVPPFLAEYENTKTSKQWKVADAEKASAVLKSQT